MSWASRIGNLGRFSPFTRSPPQGSSKVRDEDFSYITADDLRRHGAEGAGTHHHSPSAEEMGPPRDTDVLVLRNKRKEYAVHFPAYSLAKGELTVGQLREQAAKKAGTADSRRVKLLFRGKNLKEDARTCQAEGLRDGSELLLTIADAMASASGSEDSDSDAAMANGGEAAAAGEGEGRRKRNRGKKSKKKAKREDRATDTFVSSSQPSARRQSPNPPSTPATAIDKIRALRTTLQSFQPQVEAFQRSPPEDAGKREYEHKRLSETVLTQVLLKLDGVETEGDPDARAKRKELVNETQAVLQDLDAVVR